jgi:hypothetical protein
MRDQAILGKLLAARFHQLFDFAERKLFGIVLDIVINPLRRDVKLIAIPT